MAAIKVFGLENGYSVSTDGSETGVCTSASLLWCKVCLEAGKKAGVKHANPFKTMTEVYDAGETSIFKIMRTQQTVKGLDSSPVAQSDHFGLVPVGTPADNTVANAKEAFVGIESSAPTIGIFWNSYHTMAFRVDGGNFEYFDMNYGFYKAGSLDEQVSQYKFLYRTDPVIGYRVVELKP